ncbi:excalibur calcium-binding domain-containing protein [[Actinomadura] parvosata]|uniref:excalibur calcium-binding domain-containing protein n=1 Tax=[Actinomadura] parvosata TaxID=1955412 RepID=UPI0009ABE03E
MRLTMPRPGRALGGAASSTVRADFADGRASAELDVREKPAALTVEVVRRAASTMAQPERRSHAEGVPVQGDNAAGAARPTEQPSEDEEDKQETRSEGPASQRSGQPGTGLAPNTAHLREVNAQGDGPYIRSVDHEYGCYQDRDGDGVACERR